MIAAIALAVLAALILLFIFLPVVAWIIVGLVLLLIILILFIPVGADISYIDGQLKISAKADGFLIKVYPREKSEKKERKPKEKKPEKEKPKKEKKEKTKLSFSADEIIELLKKVFEGIGKFGKITVHRFLLHYLAGGSDPYNTAVTFNYVNAGLSVLAPVCGRKFNVRGDVDVRTDIDFTAEKMKIDAAVCITIRIAQVLHMVFAIAFGALGVLIRNKIRLAKEKRAEKKLAKANKNTDSDKTQDERMNSNG